MPTLKNRDHQPKRIRHDIQALRALAVVSVILYHLWPERLVGGFTGVDIFFVISGYLMTTSIMGRLTPLIESHNINPKSTLHLLTEFYARRIKRLVPAALIALLGTLGLAILSGNLNVLLTNAQNVISSATFWQNWHLANDSLNYLQQDNLILATQHFWSLSLEEQFYLIWPLLLVLSTLITINIIILFKKQKISGAILPITLVTLLSLAYGIWLTEHNSAVAYYSTLSRVWELMIGGIIAFLPIIKNYDLKLLMPYAGVTINLYSIFFIASDGFPGWLALLPTTGTALIIWAGAGRTESRFAFDNLFSWRPIQWTGDISYSLYLWHFPLIILLPIIGHHDPDGPHGRLFKLGIIVLSFIIAQLSYMYIERNTQKLNLKTQHVYALVALATGLVVGCGVGLQYYAQAKTQTNLNAMHAAAIDKSNTCFGARAILNQKKCGNPFGKINPAYTTIAQHDKFLNLIQDHDRQCFEFYAGGEGEKDTTKYCEAGDTKSNRAITLLGDSHAEQYINAFDAIGKQKHLKIRLFNFGFCGNIDFRKNLKLCQDRISYLLSSIKPKDIVVVSFLFRQSSNAKDLLATLKNSIGTNFVLLQDEPRTKKDDLTSCYTLQIRCETMRSTATKSTRTILKKLVDNGTVDNDQVINLDDLFCDSSKCYSFIGGVPVYFNSATAEDAALNSHITASYSLSLAPLLEKKIEKVLTP